MLRERQKRSRDRSTPDGTSSSDDDVIITAVVPARRPHRPTSTSSTLSCPEHVTRNGDRPSAPPVTAAKCTAPLFDGRTPSWLNGRQNSMTAIARTVEHSVIPQLLRPTVGAYLPWFELKTPTLLEFDQCCDSLWVPEFTSPEFAANVDSVIAFLPSLTSVSLECDGGPRNRTVLCDSTLASLGQHTKHLTRLSLVNALIGPASLLPIQELQITQLTLNDCEFIHVRNSSFFPMEIPTANTANTANDGDMENAFAVVGSMHHLTSLSLRNCSPSLDAKAVRLFSRSNQLGLCELTTLDLSGNDLDVGTMREVGGLSALKTLTLNKCLITPGGLDAFVTAATQRPDKTRADDSEANDCDGPEKNRTVEFPNLKHSSRHDAAPASNDLLDQVGGVTTLHLSDCRAVSVASMARLAALPSLTALDLHRCPGVGTSVLDVVSSMPSIEVLDLSECRGVRTEGLRCLSRMTKLHTLALNGCINVDDAGIAAVDFVPNLSFF